jgi:hypothetical protein
VHHCGLPATLAELRHTFWVPRGRQVDKKIIGRFFVCKRHLGKAYYKPKVGSLPGFRVKETIAFS